MDPIGGTEGLNSKRPMELAALHERFHDLFAGLEVGDDIDRFMHGGR